MYDQLDKGNYDYRPLSKFGSHGTIWRMSPEQLKSPYIACLGAAQTWGRFCPRPFPKLLERKLGLPCVNFGYAGAGPEMFLNDEIVLQTARNARLVILQVMSGRSCSTRYYAVQPTVSALVQRILPPLANRVPPEQCQAGQATHKLLQWIHDYDEDLFNDIVHSCQHSIVRLTIDLIHRLRPAKVLFFWFSRREPSETTRYRSYPCMTEFPQMVNQRMWEKMLEAADYGVMCVSSRGLPCKVVNETQKQVTNHYYPSPEMHDDALESLAEPVRSLLRKTRMPV